MMLAKARQGAGQPRPSTRSGWAGSKVEESPGSTKQGWRVTPAGLGDFLGFRESATESKPPIRLPVFMTRIGLR